MKHPYLPLTDAHRQEMLNIIGVGDVEDLLEDIPKSLRLNRKLGLPSSEAESNLRTIFNKWATQNKLPEISLLGAGVYDHYIPAVVDYLAGRSEFYTAYTPYQPEISQGMLQVIFEFQTFISELFGLPFANASLYDGATALAEAVLMAVKESKKNRVLIPESLNPAYRKVLETYTKNLDVAIEVIPHVDGIIEPQIVEKLLEKPAAAVVVQNPNFFGIIEDLSEIIKIVKANQSFMICTVNPLGLALFEAPGKLGADIVVGEGQPLGLPMAYGGPYLGLMAVSEQFLRRIPGRIVGQTVDLDGKRAFVLTLQTREQHIRREKATSNICSNQALCALRATVYLSLLGPQGFKDVAKRCFNNAHYLQTCLKAIGYQPLFDKSFFMEFTIKTPMNSKIWMEKLLKKGILGGYELERAFPELTQGLMMSVTEKMSKDQLDWVIREMEAIK